jgi:hypothetical protein
MVADRVQYLGVTLQVRRHQQAAWTGRRASTEAPPAPGAAARARSRLPRRRSPRGNEGPRPAWLRSRAACAAGCEAPARRAAAPPGTRDRATATEPAGPGRPRSLGESGPSSRSRMSRARRARSVPSARFSIGLACRRPESSRSRSPACGDCGPWRSSASCKRARTAATVSSVFARGAHPPTVERVSAHHEGHAGAAQERERLTAAPPPASNRRHLDRPRPAASPKARGAPAGIRVGRRSRATDRARRGFPGRGHARPGDGPRRCRLPSFTSPGSKILRMHGPAGMLSPGPRSTGARTTRARVLGTGAGRCQDAHCQPARATTSREAAAPRSRRLPPAWRAASARSSADRSARHAGQLRR